MLHRFNPGFTDETVLHLSLVGAVRTDNGCGAVVSHGVALKGVHIFFSRIQLLSNNLRGNEISMHRSSLLVQLRRLDEAVD